MSVFQASTRNCIQSLFASVLFFLLFTLDSSMGHAASTPIHINFDDVDTRIHMAASLPDIYSSFGVRFYNPSGITADNPSGVTLYRDGYSGNGASSYPNSLGFANAPHSTTIIFINPLSGGPGITDFIQAYVGDKSDEPDLITLRAFGCDGSLLGTSTYLSRSYGDFGSVQISAAGIHKAEFSNDNGSGADLDDLTFNPPVSANCPTGPEDFALKLVPTSSMLVEGEEFLVNSVLISRKQGVFAWRYGVTHDSALIDLIDVVIGDIPNVNVESSRPEVVDNSNGWVQLGTLMKPIQPGGLGENTTTILAQARYRVRTGVCTSNIRLSSIISYSDQLKRRPEPEFIPVPIQLEIGESVGVISYNPNDTSAAAVFIPCSLPPPLLACFTAISLIADKIAGTGDFIRGDFNSNGDVDISDPIATLNHLFLDPKPIEHVCASAGDANDDGRLDVSDAIFALSYMFLNRPVRLPLPGDNCGFDPTPDQLSCEKRSCGSLQPDMLITGDVSRTWGPNDSLFRAKEQIPGAQGTKNRKRFRQATADDVKNDSSYREFLLNRTCYDLSSILKDLNQIILFKETLLEVVRTNDSFDPAYQAQRIEEDQDRLNRLILLRKEVLDEYNQMCKP